MFIELPNQDHLRPSKRKIIAKCGMCDNERELRRDYYNNLVKNSSNKCVSCAMKEACAKGTVGTKESRSKASKNKWKKQEFRDKITQSSMNANCTDEYKLSQSKRTTELWENEDYAQRVSDGVKNVMDDDMKSRISKSVSDKFQSDPKYRLNLSNHLKEKWNDSEYRSTMAEILARQPKISSLQMLLYQYLRDLDINHYEESELTRIGYYVFDCLVPKQGGMYKNLLIECQGDYWHSPDMENGADKRKFTYIDRYFPEYEIMYLWEHEFSTKDRIINRLKSKFGVSMIVNDFDFNEIEIKIVSYVECSKFLDAYHYVGKGRGGMAIGAFFGDVLIGCIVYSMPLRQNQNFGKPFRELSRLCIHPSYQKKNFASWFIARSYKFLDVKLIISFCDTTAGHDGAVYKASNFKLSHETKPDYWYVDVDGFVMHKKTLYNKAVNLRMTESEYAVKYKFSKRYGGKKLCFIREI